MAVIKAEFDMPVLLCPKVWVKKLKNKIAPAITPLISSFLLIVNIALNLNAKIVSAPIKNLSITTKEVGIPDLSANCTAINPAPQRSDTNNKDKSASLTFLSK